MEAWITVARTVVAEESEHMSTSAKSGLSDGGAGTRAMLLVCVESAVGSAAVLVV